MATISSYNNDKVVVGEVEYPANDPASGAFFQPDYKKNEDLKIMLDGSKDSLKLEAMKRIIGMIAKGRDASDLFPAVVKNVVSKNIEVKKLVYVYLVRYAEEQQDLALLSISTFQRALKDPNQLIRASALRVLSSIRVTMIVPIVMLAIRDSASDMSPYVRKTAAHAIPKLYSLDPEQKEELVSIIDKLLSDKAPLVVGSAAMAFSEVCPDRITLIHRSYRKLCSLLADVDEWGQLTLLNVLTVYARTCFPDPNVESYSSDSETDKPFYDSENSAGGGRTSSTPSVEADLRLLLRAARPLLQSRNSGVVLAVAQLYYHCAPAQELPPVAKAMIRLLRAPLEVQSVVLNSIAALTVSKRSLFEPFLKSFFVRTSDPTHIKLLKLEIMTNLATEASASTVLREFQTYVTSSDKTFAAHTIQAIGRLAVAIHTETETCLNGLLHLLSSKDEWVVCEAVVVVKRVVGGGGGAAPAVARAARLLRAGRLGGAARAAAVWLVAEHGAAHPRAAAILAHMATTFPDQEELVKLQLLSLAVKLSISQPETLPVCQYVVSLARYDVSYDVRDRARLLRKFLPPSGQLGQHAGHIFAPDKPKPAVQSNFKDRQQWTLGSLSQYLGTCAAGYRPLPPAPPHATGAQQRGGTTPPPTNEQDNTEQKRNKSFYSEPESSGSGSTSSSSESSSEEESSEEEEESTEDKKQEKPAKEINNYRSSNSGTSETESDSDSSSESESESGSGSEQSSDEDTPKKTSANDDKVNHESNANGTVESTNRPNEKSNLELLLELDEVASTLPTMTPTCGGFLSPPSLVPGGIPDDGISCCAAARGGGGGGAALVSRAVWGGVAAARRFPRRPHLVSHKLVAVDLLLTNHTANDVTDIRLQPKNVTGSRQVVEFPPVASLPPGASVTLTIGIDFADSIQPQQFLLIGSNGEVTASITPPVGELMRAVTMSEARWDTEHKRLRGMTECDKKAVKLQDEAATCQRVYETANVGPVTTTGTLLRFAAQMLSSQDLVLLSVKIQEDHTVVTANCPNMAIASLLANDIANAFTKT